MDIFFGYRYREMDVEMLMYELSGYLQRCYPNDRFRVKHVKTCNHDGMGYHGYVLYRDREVPNPGRLRRLFGCTWKSERIIDVLRDNYSSDFGLLRLLNHDVLMHIQPIVEIYVANSSMPGLNIQLDDYRKPGRYE
jgi:hypothetical protein